MGRENQANFHNLLMQTSDNRQRFVIRNDVAMHACPDCNKEFPQSDEGWSDLKQHRMDHGRPTTYKADELRGKTLEIFVVETDDSIAGVDDGERSAFDIYGQDDEGTVYHLASQNRWSTGGWKWKRSPQKNSPQDMPNVLELLSSGSKNTVAR